jgi:flavin reductase (DIM6/NTAB) family NADH-FMN oxidoreductase RutF
LTVPRPIGWISTVSKDGIGNLSPYSYFNGLSYNPPFVMFSAGNRVDGSKKDSVLNAEETGEFVVNVSTWDTRHQMNDTSWIMESETDELLETGLTPISSINVKPKRVAESPVHFECKYHQTIELPGKEGFHHVVIGQVIGIHIKDEFITDDGIVDVLKMKIIARLGYNDYTLIEKTFSIVDFKDKGKMTRGWK